MEQHDVPERIEQFVRSRFNLCRAIVRDCGGKSAPTAQPGGKTETDEVAVMIDTRDALDVAAMPAGVEFEGYVKSWRPPDMKQAAE